MNRYAAALGLADTHYANPIGLDQRGNHSSALDLAALARRLLRIPVFARIADSKQAVLRSVHPRRRIETIDELLDLAPWVNGVKTGHTFGARYVLVGSGRRKGVELIAAVVGAETDEDRFEDTLAAARIRLLAVPQAGPGSRRPGSGAPVDPLPGRRAAAARRPQRRRRGAAGPAGRSRGAGAAAGDRADSPRRRPRPGDRPRRRLARRRACRCAPAVPWRRRARWDRARSFAEDNAVWIALALLGILVLVGLVIRRFQAMILTVTLNAAIDRTVAVPNFRLGHRHRAVESRTVAGGKGINVARALRLLGRPVIAAGFAGGPTGNRVLEQLRARGDPHRLHLDRRRDADQHGGDRPDLGRADRDQRARPGGQRRGGRALRRAARATWPTGRGSASSPARLPPGAGEDLYARLVGELRERGVTTILDSEGEAMLAGLRAGASIVTPNEREAEELVGQEFADRDDLVHGPRRAGPAGRRRGGDHAARRLRRGGRQRAPSGAWSRSAPARWNRSRRSAPGDAFLAGYAAALYDGREPEECLAYGVAAGAESTQHFGAGTVDRRGVERLLDEVEVRDLEVHAEV